MKDNLKLAALLFVVVCLFALPSIVSIVWQDGLPTSQAACRGHRGVQELHREGHFGSVATYSVLCRDGYSADVAAP